MAEFDITSREEWERRNTGGHESDWIASGPLAVTSGSIIIGDASFPTEDGKQLPLPAGTYTISFREYRTDEWSVVSRVRISLGREYKYDHKAGYYGVDSGLMAIGDYETVRSALEDDCEAAYWAWNEQMTEHRPTFVQLSSAGNAPLWVSPSGSGDGVYDIFTLRSGDLVVGYESIFIGASPETEAE